MFSRFGPLRDGHWETAVQRGYTRRTHLFHPAGSAEISDRVAGRSAEIPPESSGTLSGERNGRSLCCHGTARRDSAIAARVRLRSALCLGNERRRDVGSGVAILESE